MIAVQLLNQLHARPLQRFSKKLDLPLRTEMGLCIALGCSELSLLKLTAAYSIFANGGLKVSPYSIQRIEDAESQPLYQHTASKDERVLSEFNAYRMRRLLSDAIQYGTGRRARIANLALGGKTGTNDGPRDAWFIGFTPTLVMGVWLGNDDNAIMPAEQGGRTPAEIWRRVITEAARQGLIDAQRGFPCAHGVFLRSFPFAASLGNLVSLTAPRSGIIPSARRRRSPSGRSVRPWMPRSRHFWMDIPRPPPSRACRRPPPMRLRPLSGSRTRKTWTATSAFGNLATRVSDSPGMHPWRRPQTPPPKRTSDAGQGVVYCSGGAWRSAVGMISLATRMRVFFGECL